MSILSALRRKALSVCLAALCCCTVTIPALAQEFMNVSDLREGMTGYAKTVVQGNTIETFPVEILGVMKNSGPAGDLILAKFSGPLIEQTGGIAQGMSGSPVYIDDKLVGAIAYGWSFTNSRVGMITPIGDMLKLWNVPVKEEIRPFNARESSLIPIATPIMVSGFEPVSMDWMKNKLAGYQFMPVDTATAAADETARPLEAGGSVAAALVDGNDMKMGAIGTVTYVDNDNIVAFGHPFLKKGSINYFMHNAYIFTIVNNMSSSFKLGSIGAEVGRINQDRGAGIAGRYNDLVPGIPVIIKAHDLDTGTSSLKRVKIIEDNELTPVLAATSVYNTVNKTIDRSGGGTASLTYTIRSSNGRDKDVTRHNMYYSEDNINEKSIDELYNVLDILKHNEFIDYPILDITMSVDITQAKKSARIVDATAAPVVVSPGDMVYFKVTLHPYRGVDEVKTMSFTVPKDQPLGDMVLEIRGGGVIPLPYLIEKQRYNLTDEILERLRHYKDYADLKKTIEKEDANNDLVIEILQQNVSMINGGEEKVPKEKIRGKEPEADDKNMVRPDKHGLNDDGADEDAKASLATPYIVQGDGQITIKVVSPKDRDAYLAKNHQINEAKAVISEEAGESSVTSDADRDSSDRTGAAEHEQDTAVRAVDMTQYM
ncbi:SpoIVB peptidase S55 domain-containing protein [uncultured Megasphaera sp.]|uniref:SpoIVB peptidase S55 domain-containing protein n=1 Tax=uncultured Megasphaera sp. TaxID=165188 RepID=UPI002658E87E|nr:SpoIVB peptidase S55 domain-containing protein [uncultured Megasphaera sp.]